MNLKKIKQTLTTNKSSTQLTMLRFFLKLFLIVSIISSKIVFACGITSATLYIGDTIERAENHNTSIVYRPVAYENGWHIHWDISPPDDYVEGFIWDTTDDLNRGYFWCAPSDREESGGSSYLPGLSVGPHIIKAKIHKAGSEQWFWSNPRTVVYVAVGKVRAYFNGNWYDADEDIFVVLKGTKCTFKAFPNPPTAIWPTWPNPEPSWQFNGEPLNPSGEDTKELTFDTEGIHSLRARCGSYDDGKYYIINVIVPEPDQVSFVDWFEDEEHDIYDITDPVWKRVSSPDDPASYTKDNYIQVEAKFWESVELTFPTGVHVDVETVENGWPFIVDNDVTFQSWPSETTEHGSTNKLANEIDIYGFNLKWKYKVPSGTNEWIPMSNTGMHGLFAVYGPPQCGGSHYTVGNIYDAVGKALGGTTEAVIASLCNDNVAWQVFRDPVGCICEDGFQKNFDAAMGEYPTSGAKGMCCCRAEGLNCVLQVLGIGPYTHDYVNELPEPNPSMSIPPNQYCAICDKTCVRVYWDGFWNNWEGVVKAGGNGSMCYAPAHGSISIDEGTYSQIDSAIATDCGYYWAYGPTLSYTCPHLDPP